MAVFAGNIKVARLQQAGDHLCTPCMHKLAVAELDGLSEADLDLATTPLPPPPSSSVIAGPLPKEPTPTAVVAQPAGLSTSAPVLPGTPATPATGLSFVRTVHSIAQQARSGVSSNKHAQVSLVANSTVADLLCVAYSSRSALWPTTARLQQQCGSHVVVLPPAGACHRHHCREHGEGAAAAP